MEEINLSWLKKCMVGKVHNASAFMDIQEPFFYEGLQYYKGSVHR